MLIILYLSAGYQAVQVQPTVAIQIQILKAVVHRVPALPATTALLILMI